MEIKRENVGRIALLDKIVSDVNALIENNEITKAESLGILRRANKLMQNVVGEIVSVDYIEEDSIVSSRQLQDIIESINYNYIYYAAEIDLLNSMAKIVSSFVDGEIDRAKQALARASETIDALKIYTSSTSTNPYAIYVSKEDLSSSDHTEINGAFSAKLNSTKNIGITSINPTTSSLVGNLLEMDKSVPIYNPLEDYEVKFIDERNVFGNKTRLKDNSEDTVFEFEAYSVDNNTEDELILLDIKKRISGTSVATATYETIEWNKAPSDNILVGTISIESASPFNCIQLVPNLLDTYQKVKYISVSPDGNQWNVVAENVFLVPDINTYDKNFSEFNGTGFFFIPKNGSRFAKIVLEQDTPYDCNIAHCFYHEEGETAPQVGEFWSVTNISKLEFFSSDTIIKDSRQLGKDAMAITGKRWSISLKGIKTMLYRYDRESIIESKEYSFPGSVLKVGLSVNEIIPSGTSVLYEISPDGGASWEEINPLERSDGGEIISFSDNDYDSQYSTVKTVKVDSLPTSLKLRVTIRTDKNNSPVIKDIVLNPVLSLED